MGWVRPINLRFKLDDSCCKCCVRKIRGRRKSLVCQTILWTHSGYSPLLAVLIDFDNYNLQGWWVHLAQWLYYNKILLCSTHCCLYIAGYLVTDIINGHTSGLHIHSPRSSPCWVWELWAGKSAGKYSQMIQLISFDNQTTSLLIPLEST